MKCFTRSAIVVGLTGFAVLAGSLSCGSTGSGFGDGGAPGSSGGSYSDVVIGTFGNETCNASGKICVNNEIHECSADGGVGAKVAVCNGAGEACIGGECKTGCAAAAINSSNIGCEFWAVDLDQENTITNNAAGAVWGLVVSNAGLASSIVTVEINDAEPGQPQMLSALKSVTLAPRTVQTIEMPTREVDGSLMGKNEGPGTMLSSRAFRVRSTEPIIVYQLNALKAQSSNDASLLLPTASLGQTYRALSWPAAKPVSVLGMAPDHGYLTIVGTVAGTVVTVKVSQAILGGGGIPKTPKDGIVTATLGPFDVLNLETEGSASDLARSGDLTGSIVQATAPVAVFVGTESSTGYLGNDLPPKPDPANDACCLDHLEEQLLPVESYGKNFAIPRSPPRGKTFIETDAIRFLGVASSAVVTTSLPAPNNMFTLAPGEVRDLRTALDFVATATEPVAIGQVQVNRGFTEDFLGDPSLSILPAIDQFRQDYLFSVPTSWRKNYVALAMPEGTLVKQDGAAITGCAAPAPMGAIAGVKYVALRCDITEGVHTINADKPFGLMAYGYGNAGSYAFVGGTNVRKIYTPPPLK
jgi:IgGFc binding protein